MISLTLQAVVYCAGRGCFGNFECSISANDVDARIEEGGSISIYWPTPALPEGWGEGASSYSGPFCPTCQQADLVEHERRLLEIKRDQERKRGARRRRKPK